MKKIKQGYLLSVFPSSASPTIYFPLEFLALVLMHFSELWWWLWYSSDESDAERYVFMIAKIYTRRQSNKEKGRSVKTRKKCNVADSTTQLREICVRFHFGLSAKMKILLFLYMRCVCVCVVCGYVLSWSGVLCLICEVIYSQILIYFPSSFENLLPPHPNQENKMFCENSEGEEGVAAIKNSRI